jgi:hypothetical protein
MQERKPAPPSDAQPKRNEEDGETIGKLYLESPMRFEGDAEESARIFFEHVIKRATETN